jgi:hypothetical protein
MGEGGSMPSGFYSTASVGPLVGPLRHRDSPDCFGVYDEDGQGFPIGIAYGVRWLLDDRGPVATFRLAVNGVDLPGLYVVEDRRFVPADEWKPKATDPVPDPRPPIKGTSPEAWPRCLTYRAAYGMATRGIEDERIVRTYRTDAGRLLKRLAEDIECEMGGDPEMREAVADGVADAVEGRQPRW